MARSRYDPDRGRSAAERRNRDRRLRLAMVVGLFAIALAIQVYQWRTGNDSSTVPSAATKPAADSRAKKNRPTIDRPAKPRPSVSADEEATASGEEPPAEADEPPARAAPPAKSKTVVENVSIKDIDGRVVFRGTVDLQPTLDRIAADKHLRFPNDGAVFQNREGRLPRHPAGYYHEYVHPTPDLEGPGPQRIVLGKQGEIFYTHDHCRTFKRIQR